MIPGARKQLSGGADSLKCRRCLRGDGVNRSAYMTRASAELVIPTPGEAAGRCKRGRGSKVKSITVGGGVCVRVREFLVEGVVSYVAMGTGVGELCPL